MQIKDTEVGCGLELYAKSKSRGGTTLGQHLLEAACSALTVADMSAVPLDLEQTRIAAFVSGLFHDIGKAASGFQAMIQLSNVSRWPEPQGGYRHEILSAYILYTNLHKMERWKTHMEYFRAVFLAVLTHHKAFKRFNGSPVKQIPPEQFFGEPQFTQMLRQLNCNKEKITRMWQELVERISEDRWGRKLFAEGWLPERISIPRYQRSPIDKILPGYSRGVVREDVLHKHLTQEEVRILACVRAFLITGDHLSSGHMGTIIPTPSFERYNILPPNITPHTFQTTLGNHTGNAILIAPTGSGKTEAALYWVAANQKSDHGDGKVFYVLPYSASINAMADRLHKILETETGLVGIHHAKAAEVFYSIIEDELEEGSPYKKVAKYIDPWSSIKVKSNYTGEFTGMLQTKGRGMKGRGRIISQMNKAAGQLAALSREVFYPVKVTTPHQLLKGLLQGRGWESIVTDYHGGCFIFDEIHTYDPHIVGLILGLVRTLVDDFQAKVLLMSATFPEFLRRRIMELFPETFSKTFRPDPARDRGVLLKQRHRIEVVDNTILEFIDLFAWSELGERQALVMCNTVKTAQEVYQKLSGKLGADKVLLFHSRFKQGDRNRIEKMAINHKENNFAVLVATQVVEVSLDIDFDIGICEVAPLDALVQRFGRVNRKGNKEVVTTNMWVTNHEKNSVYVYTKALMQTTHQLLREQSGSVLTETNLVELVDKLYDIHPWSDAEEATFERAYQWASKEFFRRCIPGSYRYWIEDVIDKDNNIEVILEEDVKSYKKGMRTDWIGVGKLLTSIRYNKSLALDTNDAKIPPVLKRKSYSYDQVLGLFIVNSSFNP